MINTITILGLGAGDLEQLSVGVYRKLKNAQHLYLRTKDHPVVSDLLKEGIQFETFDKVYEKHDSFEVVYEEIVETLIEKVKETDLTYAVPGHPLVAEKTVKLLLERSRGDRYHVAIEGGQSFFDAMFTALKIDPIEGFQFLDGTDLHESQLNLRQHIIIGQVYDSFIASEVKLTLMERLPDDYEVVLVTQAGTKGETIKHLPLYELDREVEINNLTSVYVPPVQDDELVYGDFQKLREVIRTLREPNGCPWDREQTHESLKKYLVEETYEVLDAIDNGDIDLLIEELGDVLLQVMLHAQIGEDDGYFNINDVIRAITEKMIRRHPHVFGDVTVQSAKDVVTNWEQIKRTEKENGKEEASILDGIPKELPSLYRAYELQKKAAKVGFDWQDVEPMWEKVKEELDEFRKEVISDEKEQMKKEFGDILFALVNLARFYKIDPEEALRFTNNKFYKRFRFIEEKVKENGQVITEMSLDELDAIWEEAKKYDC
ncbi:bifunctional methyltransferase/pyrophosphohydrolase YabN [Calidifontibacillus erzurumensis]|uniref:Nucleoside triphosphate pyrophosphohydrolase n=1 Tax=Calidifontibacillus erzurumensis TaxID=2741433 RepID=A0A8J8GFE6_9BACI|nr:nucleoside triphosphate pyrophosphohydrolase [Calidifontibacillus erzurumensis]NSL52894.1 nucleoside triphosphate pyrophosphohydrolase [Calidifontibacillus erzurumensis]